MRKIILGLMIASILLFAVFTAANNALNAETTENNSEVLKKLDDVLGNQKAMLQAIADLKQELYIIKIRVTQQQ